MDRMGALNTTNSVKEFLDIQTSTFLDSGKLFFLESLHSLKCTYSRWICTLRSYLKNNIYRFFHWSQSTEGFSDFYLLIYYFYVFKDSEKPWEKSVYSNVGSSLELLQWDLWEKMECPPADANLQHTICDRDEA